MRNFQVIGAAPTVNDDANDGYEVNSIWTNTTTDISYICVDNTVGNAIWKTIAPVLINETRFVDIDYGQATGTQDELTAAWNNIATAYSTSPSPGTVYVQPGSYTITLSLQLRDRVNLFFAEGARVSATSVAMFAAGSVQANITGHGEFSVGDAVLAVTGSSQIIFQADSVVGTNSPRLFQFSNSTASEQMVDIAVPILTNTQANGLNIVQALPSVGVGEINVRIHAQSIASGKLIGAEIGTAPGSIEITAQSMLFSTTATTDANPTGAVVRNDSTALAIYVNSDTIESASDTQAFQALPIGATNNLVSIVAHRISCRSLAYVLGDLTGTANPVLRLTAHQVNIPDLTTTTTSTIFAERGIITANIQSFENIGPNSTLFDVSLNQTGIVTLTGDRFITARRAFQAHRAKHSRGRYQRHRMH